MLETTLSDNERYLAELDALAPSGFFLGIGLKLGKPDVAINHYPEAWVRRWEQDYFLSKDPVALWMMGQPRDATARWSEISIPDNFGILDEACQHGLCYGAALVTRRGRRRSCLSVARPDREYSDVELGALADKLNLLAHLYSKHSVALTEKEIEALRQMRSGLTHAETGEALRISVSALKLRLSSAQKKLGCRNVTAAVVKAVEDGLI